MANPRLVTLDNTDPHFTWDENWSSFPGTKDDWGASGPPFLGTLKGITKDGSLNFTFRGTSVVLWGSVQMVSPNGTERDPEWDCFIDDRKIFSKYPEDQHMYSNFQMCNTTGLAEGDHTFQLMAKIRNSTLLVDSAQFTAARDLDISGLWTEVQYPDTRFTYSDGWEIHPEYLTTTTSTPGASVTFDFDGEAIIWGGQNPRSSPLTKDGLALWTIDKDPPRNFTIPVSDVDSYNQPYFKMDLKPGRHMLRVTNKGDSSTTPLAFSYLYLKNSSKTSKAVVIGGAVGGGIGALLLGLLIVFIILRRRRRLQKRSEQLQVHAAAPFVGGGAFPGSTSVHGSPVNFGPSASQLRRPELRPHDSTLLPTSTGTSSYLFPSHTSASDPLEFTPSSPPQSDTDSMILDSRFPPSSIAFVPVGGNPSWH